MNLMMLPRANSDFICSCCYAVIYVLVVWLISRVVLKVLSQSRGESMKTTVGVPPGNRSLPLIGETIQFIAAINSRDGVYDFVRVRRLRYGNCFKTNIFGQTHVFVSGPESAKMVLNNDSGKFTKRYINSIAQIIGDQSLLCASRHQHKLMRTRLNGLFSSASVSSFIRDFDEFTASTLRSWEQRGIVIVLDEALKITFKAICKMLISEENEDELERLQRDVSHVCEAMLALPFKLPWTRFYKGLQARKRIMDTLGKMINERRRGIKDHQEDFLKHLLTQEDKTCDDDHGTPLLTDDQIKDNILTMIIAGQDTTASAITWMVKYLHENQEVLNTVKAEQILLPKRNSPASYLTLEDLSDMPYASKVVKESLRIASIVTWLPRMALEDCQLEGYKIRKGWNVNVDARSIQFDPTLYNDPDKFLPARFDGESKPYSFLAFGAGPRTCLGLNMAKAMMLIFLHRLVTTYEWKVIDPDSSIEKWALFPRPKNGCPVHVTPIGNS
uniref:Cytochrome P450 n=1 Tax=Nothapodytes nimmoniana TaxID=159386 RepID=A0A7L7RBD8_NOTNI|nr:cytochrome P450 [Nothapodytes nimmoniana]